MQWRWVLDVVQPEFQVAVGCKVLYYLHDDRINEGCGPSGGVVEDCNIRADNFLNGE